MRLVSADLQELYLRRGLVADTTHDSDRGGERTTVSEQTASDRLLFAVHTINLRP